MTYICRGFMGNYFSYMRISTKEERGKQKFSRQEVALEKYAKENGIKFTLEFKEDISGKNFEDRIEWNKLEAILQSGDTIVFKDVSRFTREALNGESKYMSLLSRGVDLIFIDNQTISTPYIKKLLEVMEYDVPYTSKMLMEKLGLKSKEGFRRNYLRPAIDMNLIHMTIPDKPNSRNQRYVKI